jgi:hypothetical protein
MRISSSSLVYLLLLFGERTRIATSVRLGTTSKYSDHLLPSLGKSLMRISSSSLVHTCIGSTSD